MTVAIPGFEPTAGPEVPGGTYSLEYNASKAQLVLYSPFDNATHKCALMSVPWALRVHMRTRPDLLCHPFMILGCVVLCCIARYELNTMYDAWMHVDDEHQLLELLMRHMTSRCNGYPAF